MVHANHLKRSSKLLFQHLASLVQKIGPLVKKLGTLVRTFWKENFAEKKVSSTFLQDLSFLLDFCFIFFSLLLSSFLLESDFSEYSSGFLVKNMIVFTLTVASFSLFFQSSSPAFLSSKATIRSFSTVLCGTGVYGCFLPFLGQIEHFSWYTPLFNIFICTGLMALPRFFLLFFSKKKEDLVLTPLPPEPSVWKVLLVGAFSDVEAFWIDKNFRHYPAFDPVAIITLTPFDFGRHIGGIPVVGTVNTLEDFLKRKAGRPTIEGLLIVSDSLSPHILQTIERKADAEKISILTVMRRPYVEKKLDTSC
ncbi:hypothetical protein AGMMS49949_00520 [Alphaproteobacteria bacterium]|nr:hypothetical protein AGMMS49949_00520 [Alphaproteobacteria bacterium]GHS95581.1 hypothetical protein AGMMS50296_0170 [Alphaproteobacteria bacterium]